MIYTIFLFLYLFHQYCVYGTRFKLNLEVTKAKYKPWLELINKRLEEGNEKYNYIYLDNDSRYFCEFQKFRFVLPKAGNTRLEKLFTTNNEDTIKEVIDKLKERLFLAIKTISPPDVPFADIEKNAFDWFGWYFNQFRRVFYLGEKEVIFDEENNPKQTLLSFFKPDNENTTELKDKEDDDIPKGVEDDTNIVDGDYGVNFLYFPQETYKADNAHLRGVDKDNANGEVLPVEEGLNLLLDVIIVSANVACHNNDHLVTINCTGATNKYGLSTRCNVLDKTPFTDKVEFKDNLDITTKDNLTMKDALKLFYNVIKFVVQKRDKAYTALLNKLPNDSKVEEQAPEDENTLTQDNVEGGDQ